MLGGHLPALAGEFEQPVLVDRAFQTRRQADVGIAFKLTPLQVQLHLTLALEVGFQTGEKPVTAELVETVLSGQLDDLEPTLTRHGYRLKDMVEQFDAKPAEIRALFSNQLEPARAAELRERILAAGLPI